MKKDWKKEEIAEDFCFTCKDGGDLRVCDFKNCLKAYHASCVGKDTTFLEDDDHWACNRHLCGCGEGSIFQCYCCPTSFCDSCVKSAQFVKVKRKTKGFCVCCLRLAKMIEEENYLNSDGEEVDFNNSETFEFLFKDYWAMIKEQEGLTVVDVQAADVLLKRGELFQNESDSDKSFGVEQTSEPDDWEDDSIEGKRLRGKRGLKRPLVKKAKKERIFTGWASEELLTFLKSLGIDTTIPRTQVDVAEMVKDYVKSKNLFQPNKKRNKHVIVDEKLHSLFRKKKIKYHKIFELMKVHLAESSSDYDLSFSSEENKGIFAKKRQFMHPDNGAARNESNHYRKNFVGPAKSCYAAISVDNIKLAYLKKSLVMELLKYPETIEEKVVGCFVRVKNDPKDFYYMVKNAHQIGQVTGIRKAGTPYNIGETMTNIVLVISNFFGEVKLSLLSDDDIDEEECQYLRELVKSGLFKQPTVAQLEAKIRTIHKDVTKHWIKKEIARLQREIDRANEKGWRRELDEYINRRELLLTENEQRRLLEEIPEVTADGEIDIEANVTEPYLVNEECGFDVAKTDCTSLVNAAGGITDGDALMALENDTHYHSDEDVDGIHQDTQIFTSVESRNAHLVGTNVIEDAGTNATENVNLGSAGETAMQKLLDSEMPGECGSGLSSRGSDNHPEIRDEVEYTSKITNLEVPIIYLNDSDDGEVAHVSEENNPATANAVIHESNQSIWHYIDPVGREQGPFTLTQMKGWEERGYFEDDFMVWRSGQSQREAVLLKEVLDSAFPN